MVQSNRFGILMALGVVVILVSALADVIGVGRVDTFGWKQIAGVIAGAIVIGIAYYLRAGRPRT